MPLTSTARSPLVQQVIDQLRAQITHGEWVVGARIPAEPELTAQLGVGRNTLREAVKALCHAGLLECRQGSGTYVRATSELAAAVARHIAHGEFREIIEIRRALEVEAARLATQRRTTADMTAIDAALTQREEAWTSGEVERFIETDSALHEAIVAAAHNRILTELYNDFGVALRTALTHVVGDMLTPESYVDHSRLVEAIRTHDEEKAATEVHCLLTESLRKHF